MNILLERYGSITGIGTLGKLSVGDKCYNTIEREWKNNAPFISCIPDGVYYLNKYEGSKKFAWRIVNPLLDVYAYKSSIPPSKEARWAILMHIANTVGDLSGCIGVGEFRDFIVMQNKIMVTRSGICLEEIMEVLGFEEDHRLEIRWKNFN